MSIGDAYSELESLTIEGNTAAIASELLKEIKARDVDQEVLMVTAYGDANNYKTAVEFGANGFLTKPVDFSELRKQIFKS